MTKALWKLVDLLLPLGSPRRTFVALLMRPRHWIGLVGLFVLLVARRFADVRVGLIDSERFGHFAIDFGIRFGEESLKTSGERTIYWVEGNISNFFFFDLMKRNLPCHPIVALISQLAPFFQSSKEWFIPSPHWVSASRDIDGVISRSGAVPEFLSSEDESARDWLRSVGWTEGQKIVCVLVRDSRFLESESELTPPNWGPDGSPSWGYHNYRDSDIETFVPAMEWVADQGAFVLRMGKRMAEPLSSRHPRIVDYAFRSGRSDFLDVWLFANCDLCVTTGTGPDLISVVFGRPVLFINYIPISRAITSSPATTAGKRLYDSAGKRLSLPEHFNLNFSMAQDYLQAGIVIRDLESWEILEIVKEKWGDFVGFPSSSGGDSEDRAQFIELLKGSPDANAHGWIHPDAALSEVWINELLFENAQNED